MLLLEHIELLAGPLQVCLHLLQLVVLLVVELLQLPVFGLRRLLLSGGRVELRLQLIRAVHVRVYFALQLRLYSVSLACFTIFYDYWQFKFKVMAQTWFFIARLLFMFVLSSF